MIIFTGDINLTDGYFDVGFGIGSKLSKGFNPFNHINKKRQDVWVGNFEGVASNNSDKDGQDSLFFRISPDDLSNLSFIDIFGFANNHAMQHGTTAYKDTVLSLQEKGCKVFGKNDIRSIIIEHQGRVVSLTGFSLRIDSWCNNPLYWHNPEYIEIEKELKLLPEEAYKIAYVHWGNEFINYPSSQQKKLAHWLIDKGFNLIIGMHPHILQGFEIYKDCYIFYSLGNFIFNMAWEPTKYGAIVSVDFSKKEVSIDHKYIYIGDDLSPSIVEEKMVPKSIQFSFLNTLIYKEENTEEYHSTIIRYYNKYRFANHLNIAKSIMYHPQCSFWLFKDFIRRRLLS